MSLVKNKIFSFCYLDKHSVNTFFLIGQDNVDLEKVKQTFSDYTM